MADRTIRTAALTTVALLGLAARGNAQVYIEPGTTGTGTQMTVPGAGQTIMYPSPTANSYPYTTPYVVPAGGFTPTGTAMQPRANFVMPSTYTYTNPTAGVVQTGFNSYPTTVPGYTGAVMPSTTGPIYSSPSYLGATYPTYTGSNVLYPSSGVRYYNAGRRGVSSVVTYPYNTVRRAFRR